MELVLRVALKYAAIIACLGGAVWYYGGFGRFTSKYLPTPQVAKSQPADKTAKKKKAKNRPAGRVNSGTESSSATEKKRVVSGAVAGTVTAHTSGRDQNKAPSRDNTGELGSKETEEFAKELAKAQQGIKFAGKQNGPKSKTRTVKQKAVDEDSPRMSAATSSAGQDGDDEITPAESPAFSPVISAPPPDPTGISDMLERAKEEPKSLRLTDLDNATKKQKPTVKAAEPAETKKQRQQRRRREEEKERIAQSAKEHQAKGQQQMRAARMAEGTSKQTKADSFKAPLSVWSPPNTQNKENAVKQPPSNTATTAPLDTFEKSVQGASNDGTVTTQAPSQITNGQRTPATVNGLKKEPGVQRTSTLVASDRENTTDVPNPLQRTESWADMMDEEEQLKLAEEDPASWESVPTKKDKKKARKGDGEANGDSAKQVNGRVQKSGTKNKTNSTSLKQQSNSQAANRYGSLFTVSDGNDLKEVET